MTTAVIIILSVICILLTGSLIVALYFLWKFGRALLSYVDAVEKCLDILNISYAQIHEILQTPVGSDDPFIRSVVDQIKRAHDAVLVVAHTLSQEWRENEENDEEDYDDE